MFRSRMTRMVAVAMLGVSLCWTPASAYDFYMERPEWMGTNPDDPTSARITPSLSAGEGNLPVAAALASPNVLPLTVSTIAPRIAIVQFLEEHPDKIEVCINDGPTRWQDGVTATIDSICTGGFDSSGKWQEDYEQVPCIPRYPEHPDPSEAASKCAPDPSSGQRTPVGPYVPYVTTSRLI